MLTPMNVLPSYLYPMQVPAMTGMTGMTVPSAPITGVKRKHDDVARVILSRENSLKYSSQDYETYINTISVEEPLSPAELREMKRQRRLIKNREYAQTSRNKKKEQFELLSQHIYQLSDVNSKLSEQVMYLEEENGRLRDENRRLQELQLLQNYNPTTPTNTTTTVVTSPSETDVLDSAFSSDEEPSTGDQTQSYALSGMSCAFNSIFDNVSTFGNDIFGSLDMSQSMSATLFIFCIFLVLPFISFTNPHNSGFPSASQEYPVLNSIEESSNPQQRNLLTTNNQSPWPKDQFHNQDLCKPVAHHIITMDDVYMDEQNVDNNNNISEFQASTSNYITSRSLIHEL